MTRPSGSHAAGENSPGGSFSRPARLMVSRRRPAHPHRLRFPPHPLARGRPADRQCVGDDSGGVARAQGRRHRRRSPSLHAPPGGLRRRGAARRPPLEGAARRRSRCPRAVAPRCSRRTSALAGCGSRSWSSRSRCSLPVPPRRTDPVRARHRAAPAQRLPDDLRHRTRQRRDAERRAPVHEGHAAGAARPRRQRPAHHAPHRRLLAGTRRAPVPRALRGLRAHRAPHQRARRAG